MLYYVTSQLWSLTSVTSFSLASKCSLIRNYFQSFCSRSQISLSNPDSVCVTPDESCTSEGHAFTDMPSTLNHQEHPIQLDLLSGFSFDRWCWTLLAVIHNVSVIAPSVVRPGNKSIHLYGSFISSWCGKPFLPHYLFLCYARSTVNTIYQGFPNGVRSWMDLMKTKKTKNQM